MTWAKNMLHKSKAGLAMLLAVLLSLGVLTIQGAPALAAGSATLGISITPVHPTTGDSKTTAGGDSNQIAYRISYTCSTVACEDTVINLPDPVLDPNYSTYSPIVFGSWTAPFLGATLSADRKTVNLGTLAAGSSGSFQVNYQWVTRGSVNNNSPAPGSFLPPGFTFSPAVSIESETAVRSVTATSVPITWNSRIPNPTLQVLNNGSADTGVNYTYRVRMSSNCLTIQDTAPKGDVNYTCAREYEVVMKLPAEAEFVNASNGGTYNAANHTVTWSEAPKTGETPAIGWHWRGNANKFRERTVNVRFDQAKFSPSGTDSDYCNFSESVTAEISMDMYYLGLDPNDDSNLRSVNNSTSHNVSCYEPFGKGRLNSKQANFYGNNRVSGDVPVVVYPEPNLNDYHYWSVSVGNQANVPGVAVIEEPNLAVEGTEPFEIRAVNTSGVVQNAAVINWTLNDGTVGTSNGVATAPAGKWFVSATVNSQPLSGANILPTGNAQTEFVGIFKFRVKADAPVGQFRTNTASAKMTYPNYPELEDVNLGTRSEDIRFIAPFSKGELAKTADVNRKINNDRGEVYIPDTGGNQKYWTIGITNRSNVPAVGVIEETDLGSMPAKVTRVIVSNTSEYLASGPAVLEYTLSNGVSGTTNLPFSAPSGTHITSLKITTPTMNPRNMLATQNERSLFQAQLIFSVPAGLETTSWTNSASARLTFPSSGIADLDLGSDSYTIDYVPTRNIAKPQINAGFVGNPVVSGGGNPVPGRDVTFTFRGATSGLDADSTFSPQYVFIAPENWTITRGSESFAAGVPEGVTFTYTTINGREAVVAQWPDGAEFGRAGNWPALSVSAQPSFSAPTGSQSAANAWVGESTNNWTIDDAIFRDAVTDTEDADEDGEVTEGFSSATSPRVTIGSAALVSVTKEICKPDTEEADGCQWISDPSTPVQVSTVDTGIKYRITIQNTGNSNLSNVVAYDVLPYVGDRGLIASTHGTPRGSTFEQELNSVFDVSSNLVLSYSASNNPPRPEVYPSAPGANGSWDSSPNGKKAIKAVVGGTLAPGDTAYFSYNSDVVSGAAAEAIACNSVAIDSDRTLPVEPQPVCATTAEGDFEITVPERLPLQVGRPGVIPFEVELVSGSSTAPATVQINVPADFVVDSLTPEGWACVADPAAEAPITGPVALDCERVNTAGTPTAFTRGTSVPLNLPVTPLNDSNEICVDATVTSGVYDPVDPNNDTISCLRIFELPTSGGLEVSKTAPGVTALQPGTVFSYNIQVTNRLIAEAVTGAVLVDDLPAELEYVSSSNGGVHTNGTVTWNLATLNGSAVSDGTGGTVGPAESITVTVTVRVRATTIAEIENTATVTAPDPNDADEELTAEDTETLGLRHLSIEKSSNASDPRAGDTVRFTVRVTNNGGTAFDAANPAQFSDDLSEVIDDADFNNDATATAGTTSFSSPTLSWSGPIAAGATVEISYTVTLKTGGDSNILNTACIPAALATDPDDLCAEEEFGIPKLSITKEANMDELPAVGTELIYTVVVTNTSDTDFTVAKPATMQDDLSRVLDDATYNNNAAATVGTVSYAAPNLSWSGVLEAGQSATITYSVEYNGNGDLSLRNDACIPTNLTESGYFSCANASVPSAKLDTSKSVSVGKGTVLNGGQEIVYTLTFVNRGAATATVDTFDTVADLLDDAELLGTPSSSASTLTIGAVAGGRFTIVGTIGPNATETVQYTVRVLPHDQRTNHRLVNFLGEIPTGASCVASNNNCTVNPVAHLSVEKETDAIGEITTGSQLRYILRINNDGGAAFTSGTPARFVDNLSDVLDDAQILGTPSASTGTVQIIGNELVWTGPLAIGATATVEYTVTVTNLGNHILLNTVTASNPGDLDSVATVETNLSDVRATKFANVDFGKEVSTGQELVYSITISNQGTADGAVNLVDDMKRLLDDASIIEQATSDNPNVTIRRVSNRLHIEGTLTPGETASIQYKVKVKDYRKQGDRKLINVINPASMYVPTVPGGSIPSPSLSCDETSGSDQSCTFNPISRNKLAQTGLAGLDLWFVLLGLGAAGGGSVFYSFAAKNRRRLRFR